QQIDVQEEDAERVTDFMGQPGGQAPERGQVVRAPQDLPLLVQRLFHPTQGSQRLLERWGDVRRLRRGGFERGEALTQDGQALIQEGVGCSRVVHRGLPQQRPMVGTERLLPTRDRRGTSRPRSGLWQCSMQGMFAQPLRCPPPTPRVAQPLHSRAYTTNDNATLPPHLDGRTASYELVASFGNLLNPLKYKEKQIVARSGHQAHAGHTPWRSGACLSARVPRPAARFSDRTTCVCPCSLSPAPLRAAAVWRKTRNQFRRCRCRSPGCLGGA